MQENVTNSTSSAPAHDVHAHAGALGARVAVASASRAWLRAPPRCAGRGSSHIPCTARCAGRGRLTHRALHGMLPMLGMLPPRSGQVVAVWWRAAPFAIVMELSIRDRAATVRRPRAYIGFLEWCAWSCLEQRRVLMLIGTEVSRLVQFNAFVDGASCA